MDVGIADDGLRMLGEGKSDSFPKTGLKAWYKSKDITDEGTWKDFLGKIQMTVSAGRFSFVAACRCFFHTFQCQQPTDHTSF